MRRASAICAALALSALVLTGCGASPEPGPEEAPEKGHYYEILQADGAVLYTVREAAAVAEIDDLVDAVGLEDGWPGDEGGEALYTYVLYQEAALHAGEDPAAERPYLEVLRLTVREDGDTVTAQVLGEVLEGVSDALPQVDLQGLLTFSYDAPAETAAALRDPARFGGDAGAADALARSYYAGQEDRAYRMLQKHIFQSILEGWVPAGLEHPVWNYGTFTRYTVLDQAGVPEEQAETLYCCTVSADGGKSGYVVLSYSGDGLSRVRAEETPYLYDLDAAAAVLAELDVAPAAAERVQVPDPDGGPAAEGIRFVDAQGRATLCRFGESGVAVV